MINITLSFPELIIQKIDKTRGDVSRSRYISRLVEIGYQNLSSQSRHLHREGPQKISAAKGAEV